MFSTKCVGVSIQVTNSKKSRNGCKEDNQTAGQAGGQELLWCFAHFNAKLSLQIRETHGDDPQVLPQQNFATPGLQRSDSFRAQRDEPLPKAEKAKRSTIPENLWFY